MDFNTFNYIANVNNDTLNKLKNYEILEKTYIEKDA